MTEFWQREKDSNPHKQSQSLSCYPYTIPLSFVFCDPQLTSAGLIIAKKRKLSRGFLKFFEKIFSGGRFARFRGLGGLGVGLVEAL